MYLFGPLSSDFQEPAAPDWLISGQPILPELKNYAADEETKKRVRDLVVPLLDHCRQYRVSMEEEWSRTMRMQLLQHDEGQRYLGRSDVYVPLYTKVKQTLVSSLSQGLFPSDEYLDVVDRDTGDPTLAKPTKTYVQWEFESVGRVRSHMKRFLSQLVNHGTSPMKVVYKKKLLSKGQLKRGEMMPTYAPSPVYEGLCVSVRSLFSWHIYPFTADSLADATLIFEDIETSLLDIEERVRAGVYVNDERVFKNSNPDYYAERVQHLLHQSLPTKLPSGQKKEDIGDTRVLTEAWTYLRLPRSAYLPHENPESPLPVRVVLAGDFPVLVTRNPYFHQRPPYVVARMNVDPGFFYGFGAGRVARPLQLLVNDFANQTNDCATRTLMPTTLVNPGLMAGPLRPMKPGVVWLTSDVNQGVRFESPDTALIPAGQQMLQMWMTMGQDLPGAPPVLQGSKAANTATSTQLLQRNALGPLQDIVEDIELDGLVEMAFMCWSNAQQFRSEDVMATVAGQPIRVALEQLLINPEFRWLASNQSINQMQRAQQSVLYLQTLMPYIPYINQLGYVVDPVPLFGKLYGDGLGFRGFDNVVRRGQSVLPGQLGQPSPQNFQSAQAEQGDRVRSALEQVGGQGVPMAPGEGGDFMDVRGQADQMAGMMGALGGLM